jgi:excisionase family DNA binding protein
VKLPNTLIDPVRPDDRDTALARDALDKVKNVLARHPRADRGHDLVQVTVQEDGETLVLPRSVVELMARILAHMAAGQGVSVVPLNAELTTQQAADILNVSRPFLVGLLEAGEIEYRLVGTHRRITASSLLEYQRADDAGRRRAVDELAQLGQEIGLD